VGDLSGIVMADGWGGGSVKEGGDGGGGDGGGGGEVSVCFARLDSLCDDASAVVERF